jgi:hypothetical protein
VLVFRHTDPPWPPILPLGSYWGHSGVRGVALDPVFVSSWPSPWKAKLPKSSESETATTLQPQALFIHAISARAILVLSYTHRFRMAAWSLCPFMSHLVSRSSYGAIWCRHQKQNLEHTSLHVLTRDTSTPDSNALATPIWAQRRRSSATKVAHGSGNIIKSNFGWVVIGRWFRCRATFSDACKLRCRTTTQQTPPVVFSMNYVWPEHVEWSGWCRTWGKTWWWWNVGNWRKYGVWREVLFWASKSPRKSPALEHSVGKKVTWGHDGLLPSAFAAGGLLATHLVPPLFGSKSGVVMLKFDQNFTFHIEK